MKAKIDSRKIMGAILFLGVLIEAFYELRVHRKYIFIRDDLWYATNLVTGEPLQGIADIIESQVWHFMNWGGRIVNHGLLQFVLMHGTLFADILNMVMTLALCYLICELAGKKDLIGYSLSFFMLITLNTDISWSMFWQSGSVNYLYSSNWILLFLIIYLRHVKNPDAKRLWGAEFWMIFLGLITGWSNENMGPACFVLAVMVMLYFAKKLQRKVPVWMWSGAVSSLCGSVLLILAPGNLVRSATAVEKPFWESVYDRFYMMLAGEASFLYAAVLFLLFFILIYLKKGNKLQPFQTMLIITAVLACGAMVLSPTFPNRAAFGIMVLCIVLIISFIQGIEEKDRSFGKYIFLFACCMLAYGLYLLDLEMLVTW